MPKASPINETQPDLSTFQHKHRQIIRWITGPQFSSILAAGGVRSGKTLSILTAMYFRALNAPGSHHGIFHSTRNSCKRNLFDGSFPEMLDIILPGYWQYLKTVDKGKLVDQSDLEITLPNGSKFMFMGLDDPDKVRGLKFSTVFVNEANFVDYKAIMTLRTRLSESVKTMDGGILDTKMIFDLNPTFKSSWDYQVFVEGVIPGERSPIPDFKLDYRYLTINAIDNKSNLPASLFKNFESMTAEQRRRDEHGQWGEDNPNALFDASKIGRTHVDWKTLVEIVVAIDPAGTSNAASDSTGIIVAGRDADGVLYILDDVTMKAKPDIWLAKAEELRRQYDANWILTEKDYARDILVELAARVIPNAPIKYVESRGRGKRLRAEPIAALYERGIVNHIKVFPDLEQQMLEFDAPTFKGSPDRVDALVYALQHLSGKSLDTTPKIGTPHGFWRR